MDRQRWGRIDEVFQAALEMAAGERAAYLERECGGDAELRARVERLLELDGQRLSLIELPVAELAADVIRLEPELRAGERLGEYEVLELLGVGGMGEVYLARDARLERKVALKLLPADFAASPERLSRFRTEARAASALNHPNIVTVYEVGSSDGRQFIATEYVEGATLRERLAAGRMEVGEAVDVATQIASALGVAHAAGIVHRDIKPENVMVRRDGIVKVLDFGIAKLGEEADAAPGEPRPVRQSATQAGAMVGTASYMSPEQARGDTVDARSDVFSFGVVLYELLTGEMAFGRGGSVETLHAILHDEPARLEALGRTVPAEVARAVRRCLKKDPAARYANGGALAEALERVAHTTGAAAAESGWRGWQRWSLVLGFAVLLACGGAWISFSRRPAEPERASSSPLPAMTVAPFTGIGGRACNPAFSPDDSQIVFDWLADGEQVTHAYVKPVDGGTAKRLTSSPDDEMSPVWSPDGQYIAFTRCSDTERAIIEVPAAGGPERKLLTATSVRWPHWGARIDWSPDGELIAYADADPSGDYVRIFLLTVATGQTRQLTSLAEHPLIDGQPAFSPDGRMVAFVRLTSWLVDDLYVVPVAGGEPTRLTFDGNDIWGVTWTADGRSLVFSSNRGGARSLWRIVATGGEPELLGAGSDGAFHPAISHRGQRLAYVNYFVATSMWRLDLAGTTGTTGPPTKVLSAPAEDQFPQISPDGRRIAFASTRTGPCEVWVCDSDGSNPVQVTSLRHSIVGIPTWSPDGRSIAFYAHPNEQDDIYVVGADGGSLRRLTHDFPDAQDPSWSRDGRWIYFHAAGGGAEQIWKVPAEGGEAVLVTTSPGAGIAFESPDGKYLYYSGNVEINDVYRMPLSGGKEELVLRRVPLPWAVTDEGIYFAEAEGTGGVIKFFDVATRKATRVATIDKPPTEGFAVSPDGRWLLYTQTDLESQSLMLAENFR